MKDIFKKYWKGIVLFLIVGVILIPLLIHILFKINAPIDFFVATWSSGDVLAFYGVIIGAIATVGGVYLSIQYSQKSLLKDTYNRVRPFIVIVPKLVEGKFDLLAELLRPSENKGSEKSSYYNESIIDKICFTMVDSKIIAHSKLTPEQEEIKRTFGIKKVTKSDGSTSITNTKLAAMTIVVENAGLGVANKLLIGFYKSSDYSKDQMPLSLFRHLKVGESITVELYIENPDEKDFGDYKLAFDYCDIYENNYQQIFNVKLAKDEENYIYLENNGIQKEV